MRTIELSLVANPVPRILAAVFRVAGARRFGAEDAVCQAARTS